MFFPKRWVSNSVIIVLMIFILMYLSPASKISLHRWRFSGITIHKSPWIYHTVHTFQICLVLLFYKTKWSEPQYLLKKLINEHKYLFKVFWEMSVLWKFCKTFQQNIHGKTNKNKRPHWCFFFLKLLHFFSKETAHKLIEK